MPEVDHGMTDVNLKFFAATLLNPDAPAGSNGRRGPPPCAAPRRRRPPGRAGLERASSASPSRSATARRSCSRTSVEDGRKKHAFGFFGPSLTDTPFWTMMLLNRGPASRTSASAQTYRKLCRTLLDLCAEVPRPHAVVRDCTRASRASESWRSQLYFAKTLRVRSSFTKTWSWSSWKRRRYLPRGPFRLQDGANFVPHVVSLPSAA